MIGSFLDQLHLPIFNFFFAIKARVIFELYHNRDYNLLRKLRLTAIKEHLHRVHNLQEKCLAIEMRNILIRLVFKYHYNCEASIEKEFQQFREGVDNVNMPNLVYNSLNYVIPIYKSTLMTKHTIQAKEGAQKNTLECASAFFSTPLKCDGSTRFKLRLTKHFAAQTREYSRRIINYSMSAESRMSRPRRNITDPRTSHTQTFRPHRSF